MKKTVPEILSEVSKIKGREEKKQFLKQNESPALCTVLQLNFDKSVKWLLPEGRPPFKPDDAPVGYSNSTLHMEIKKIRIFVEGAKEYAKMPTTKREMLFVQLLEAVHGKEAETLLQAKERTLKIDGVDAELVNEVWPGMIKDPLEKPKRGRPKKIESKTE